MKNVVEQKKNRLITQETYELPSAKKVSRKVREDLFSYDTTRALKGNGPVAVYLIA